MIEQPGETSGRHAEALASAGYDATSPAAVELGFEMALRESFDLILIDFILLRDHSALGLLEKIRAASVYTPIVVFCPSNTVQDPCIGPFALKAGADRVLPSVIDEYTLIVEVQALLRLVSAVRATNVRMPRSLAVGDLVIPDVTHRIVRRHGTPIRLTATEVKLLVTLMSEPGRDFSKAELLDLVWTTEYTGDTGDCVRFHMSKLRSKLDPTDTERYIQTVYGVGYRLIDPTEGK